MVASFLPLPLYRPRNPRASDLWRLMDRHFETFQRVYDARFQPKYGYWRPVVERSVAAFLRCGDLHEGFARVRCGECGQEMFVAFSCKQVFRLHLPRGIAAAIIDWISFPTLRDTGAEDETNCLRRDSCHSKYRWTP